MKSGLEEARQLMVPCIRLQTFTLFFSFWNCRHSYIQNAFSCIKLNGFKHDNVAVFLLLFWTWGGPPCTPCNWKCWYISNVLLLPATLLRARTNRDRPSPLAADQSQQVKDIKLEVTKWYHPYEFNVCHPQQQVPRTLRKSYFWRWLWPSDW